MSWQYIQRTGELLHDGAFFTKCYAGRGAGLNNPDMQSVKDVGPVCVGVYRIGNPVEGSHLGPCAMPLKKDAANVMYGRDDFYLHADLIDAVHKPHQASHGCIVPYDGDKRRQIAAYVTAGDRLLTVVAERKDAQWILPPPNTF